MPIACSSSTGRPATAGARRGVEWRKRADQRAWPRKWAAHSTWQCPRTSQARPRGRRVDIGGARPATGQSQLQRVGVGRKPTQPGSWTLEGVPSKALRGHHAGGPLRLRNLKNCFPPSRWCFKVQGTFSRQLKAIQGNPRQSKATQGNSRQFKATQGKFFSRCALGLKTPHLQGGGERSLYMRSLYMQETTRRP